MENNKYIKKWITIAIWILLGVFVLSTVVYKGVERMLICREERNLNSLARISVQSLASTLEAKQQLLYATFSGDMVSQEDIELRLLKLMEKGEYISLKKPAKESVWKKNLRKEALANPGKVVLGSVILTEEGSYSLYMAKAVSMDGRLCGYVMLELNLDEIYEREEALSGVGVKDDRYCLLKNAEGKTVMPTQKAEKDISVIAREKHDCVVEWVYETGEGTAERTKKIIAYEPLVIGEETYFLYVVDDYDKIVLPIERVAMAFAGFSLCLLMIVTVFVYQLIRQHHTETELVRELQHERTLNEVMKKQEGLMQKYNHSKTMTVLAGVIAHEFNNLVTPIVLYAELLEENECVKKEMPDEISELKSTAIRCGELARQLLDYSRQGKAEKMLVDYDATYAVQEAVNIVKKVLPENVQLQVFLTKTPYYIHGQAGAMNQIVLNLSTNAIHAMKDGGTLTIRFGKSAESGERVRLVVEDTGKGIAKEVRQKVFQPFFTTKSNGEGAGIGLTVVKRLTEEHGGQIRVKSEEGKGTMFLLDFPFV